MAPSCANLCAMARPIPLAAPVTTATFPANRKLFISFASFSEYEPQSSQNQNTQPDNSRLSSANPVRQSSDFFNRDAHFVAILQPQGRILRHPNPMRRASKNHRSGTQCRALAKKFNQRTHVKDHVARISVLQDPAVHTRLYFQCSGVANGIRSHQAWPKRRKGVKALAAAPLRSSHLQLPVARAHIISAGI